MGNIYKDDAGHFYKYAGVTNQVEKHPFHKNKVILLLETVLLNSLKT